MSKSFCYFLLQRGVLKRAQFIMVLDFLQDDAATIERLAIDRGYMSKQDAEEVMQIIARDNSNFLRTAHELGFLSRDEKNKLVNAQMDNADYLREVLEHLDFIPSDRLFKEFQEFRTRGHAEGELILDTEKILGSFDESNFSHK